MSDCLWTDVITTQEREPGTMDKIRIGKSELLDIVKKNRADHRSIFEKALEGYKAQVIAELEMMLTEAKAGKRIRRHVQLEEPMDQTKEYDRVVRMLQLTQDTVIELTQAEFSQYVMDDWRWKDQFLTNASAYLVG